MKNIMKEAHKMTKEIKREYPEVNYKFQFGLCLSYLYKKGNDGMKELKGSEKQIKWAEDIRKNTLSALNDFIAKIINKGEFRNSELTLKAFTDIKEKVENEESAKWFIENRGMVEEFHTVDENDKLISVYGIIFDNEFIASYIDKKVKMGIMKVNSMFSK